MQERTTGRGCRWTILAKEREGTLFVVQRDGVQDFAVIHMFDTRPSAVVPLDVVRSVCVKLQLLPDDLGLPPASPPT